MTDTHENVVDAQNRFERNKIGSKEEFIQRLMEITSPAIKPPEPANENNEGDQDYQLHCDLEETGDSELSLAGSSRHPCKIDKQLDDLFMALQRVHSTVEGISVLTKLCIQLDWDDDTSPIYQPVLHSIMLNEIEKLEKMVGQQVLTAFFICRAFSSKNSEINKAA